MGRVVQAVVNEAQRVQRELGPGHRENAYQKALAVALAGRKIQHTTESTCTVEFDGFPVARMHPDMVVEDETGGDILIEMKVDSDGTDQLKRYMENMENNGGIALTFGEEFDFTHYDSTMDRAPTWR